MTDAAPARPPNDGPGVRRETWLDVVVEPTLENLAPYHPAQAVSRLIWTAALVAALALLAPADPALGTATEDGRDLLAGAFAAFGVAAFLLRKKAIAAPALAGLSLVIGALAAHLSGWSPWTLAIPGFVIGTLALSAWRRSRPHPVPPSEDDPLPPVSRGLPVLAGRIASTIALVLILRLYVLETRNVPTASMQPTIMGDRPHAQGDRVLVDRVAYMLRDPRRWEIAVFDYPLQPGVSFVKRVVGLPGEHVEIRDGDVWVDGAIAPKPPLVQESLWQERFPRPGPRAKAKSVASAWSASEDHGWRRDGDGLKVAPRAGRATFATFGGRIRSADARLAAAVELDDPAQPGVLLLEIQSRGRTVLARVPLGGDEACSVDVDGQRTDAGPAPGARARARLEVIDGRARLFVGERIAADLPLDVSGRGRLRVRIGAEGAGTVRFRELSVHEDIVYTGGGGLASFDVPDDGFVVLGDNTNGSEDSRMWVAGEYHVRGRDEPIVAKAQVPDAETGVMRPNIVTRDGITRLIDVEGVEHAFPAEDRVLRKDVRRPYVRRRHLTGRATLIIWPWRVDEAGFRPRVLP